MSKPTPIAHIRAEFELLPQGRKWIKKIQNSHGDIEWDEDAIFAEDMQAVWVKLVSASIERLFREYFKELGMKEKQLKLIEVRIHQCRTGSLVIEAAVLIAASVSVTFNILKALSELPSIIDGLKQLKNRLEKILSDKAPQAAQDIMAKKTGNDKLAPSKAKIIGVEVDVEPASTLQPLEPKTILIVGDWLVDEYWFLVKHYSEASSHTGEVHYRLSVAPDEIIRDLCGAGHVARILHELGEKARPLESKPYDLAGVGIWNENDEILLKHLVHCRNNRKCSVARAGMGLVKKTCAEQPHIKLTSLGKKGQTIFVVRQYHQGGDGLRHISRVDWGPDKIPPEKGKKTIGEVEDSLPAKVEAIVIFDLGKGVVDRPMIAELHNLYPDAKWYVRSKFTRPSWLNEIEDGLELFVVGPEVAVLLNPWDQWLVNKRPTIQALETINSLPGKNVALLTDNREAIALVDGKRKDCFSSISTIENTPMSRVGWASAFFACLIWKMLQKDTSLVLSDVEDVHYLADKYGGIKAPRGSGVKLRSVHKPHGKNNDWAYEREAWRKATENVGIIEVPNRKPFLDVWRGSSHLPGYIACIKEKQNIITQIGRKLRTFVDSGVPRGSMSIYLEADPGTGKTVLAGVLAKTFGLSLVTRDITQMIYRNELLDLFDEVSTRQAKQGNKVLVFVDEINALLDGSPVYGAFLSPLEAGVYVRNGRYFSLKPCVWVFAGTRLEIPQPVNDPKFRDFKSRMTMIEGIDFESLRGRYDREDDLLKQARLEQVYLGVTMMRSYFSDLQYVSRAVLQQLHNVNPNAGYDPVSPARRIRGLAASLRNVQYGTVTEANCEDWGFDNWDREAKGQELVRLYFE